MPDVNVELKEIYGLMCQRCRDKLKRLIAEKIAETQLDAMLEEAREHD